MQDTAADLTFFTVAETAQMLRVSTKTIRNRIRDGILPAKRLTGGQTVLISRQDVLAQLEDARLSLASGRQKYASGE